MSDDTYRGQRGQSVFLVAVALIALLIFAAIAVDIANTYVHRRTAQNAADAAALAGARELARQLNEYDELIALYGDERAIKAEMNAYAERNGIDDTDGIPDNATNENVVGYYLGEDSEPVSQQVIGSTDVVHRDARGIEAIAHSVAPSFFGGLMGLDGLPVQAEAAVVLQGVCATICILPIAVLTETFETDECYNIYDGAEPGSFGWLNWSFQKKDQTCRCNAPCLAYNLDVDNCASGRIAVNEWVASDSGISNKKEIRNQLEQLVTEALSVTLIVYDVAEGRNGSKKECAEGGAIHPGDGIGFAYHVVGFAKFQLLGYSLAGGEGGGVTFGNLGTDCLGPEPTGGNRITGKFVKWAEGEGGGCGGYGTIVAPTLIR
jgi:hypothetical protein